MQESPYRVVKGSELAPQQLDAFMRQCFSETKCDFLRDHGTWRHHGNEHRYVVLDRQDQLAGYFASIPVRVCVDGRVLPAVWWMDLFVPPQLRGKGIQRVTDAAARQVGDLHLGFPNHVAAEIHRKHGWGIRSDFRVMMLPLQPSLVPHLRELKGWKRLVAQASVLLARPLAWVCRQRMYRMGYMEAVRCVEDPSPEMLAAVFLRNPATFITTFRDADHIRWRYLDSPHRSQYACYVWGGRQSPELALVTRTCVHLGVRITRILDVFGNLANRRGISSLLQAVAHDAVRAQVIYVTALATNPFLVSVLRSHGYVLATSTRLRWWSNDSRLIDIIRNGVCHWTMADSDNDTVD